MNTKERLMAAWRGEPHDHVPFTNWCFGFIPPPSLRWMRAGREVRHWYTLRLEHIHTLPAPWTLEDDFQRALAWRSLGLDDVIDISVPWSMDPGVTWTVSHTAAGELDPLYPVVTRNYQTPSGSLRHAVKHTGEDQGPGWMIQPDDVPMFEDFNVSRAVKHLVAGPEDVAAARHLYRPPGPAEARWTAERIEKIRAFAERENFPVQAWTAFGMDALVWMTGVQGAIFLAMDHPAAFTRLMDAITETDLARTELALQTPGVDLVVGRGWYASTEIWSPRLLERYLIPHVTALADLVHRNGKPFAYVMTTGIRQMGSRLADAGVDVLYFIDPISDRITLEYAQEKLAHRMTLVGGISALTLSAGKQDILANARYALDILGKSNRFILQPVDSIFPDTPWDGLQTLIEVWRKYVSSSA